MGRDPENSKIANSQIFANICRLLRTLADFCENLRIFATICRCSAKIFQIYAKIYRFFCEDFADFWQTIADFCENLPIFAKICFCEKLYLFLRKFAMFDNLQVLATV